MRVGELRTAHRVIAKSRPDCGKRKDARLQIAGPHREQFLLPSRRNCPVGAEIDIFHS
jgi:hypothetical protein